MCALTSTASWLIHSYSMHFTTFTIAIRYQEGKKVSAYPRFCERHRSKRCSNNDHFRFLKTCKLYRVEYKQADDWEIFFRYGPNLKSLHLESSRNMTDTSFHSVLSEQGLSSLEVLWSYHIRVQIIIKYYLLLYWL